MTTSQRAALTNEWVMRLQVVCGPDQPLGDTPDGRRTNYDILGGTLAGPAIAGVVLPGGADWFLERPDGVGQLDARYSLRTDDGVVINVHNRGLLREEPVDGGTPVSTSELSAYTCHCLPVFDAPEGRYGWLNREVFAGVVAYPEPGQVVIDVHRLLGQPA